MVGSGRAGSPAEVTREALAGLALSVLPPRGGEEALLRALQWCNLINKIGHHLPLVFCHDLGRLLVEGPSEGPRRREASLRAMKLQGDAELNTLLGRYEALIRRLGRSELVLRAPSLALSDEAVAALIARICEAALESGPGERVELPEALSIDPSLIVEAALPGSQDGQGASLAFERGVLKKLVTFSIQIVTAAEGVDLDTLRLISLFTGDDSLVGAQAALDVFSLLGDTSAADIIHFSMELLPQIMEGTRAKGLQHYSIDGVAGVSRRGHPDQLLASELASPDELFYLKIAEGELLYYGHEAERQRPPIQHLVMIDASASMRGSRTIFARGLALALLRRLVGLGESVSLRFFDSALYDPVELRTHDFQIPYLLSFVSERGRNTGRVFADLLDHLKRQRRRSACLFSVTFITHGQCHVDAQIMLQLSKVAHLHGVFVLSDSTLELNYLQHLHAISKVLRSDLSEGVSRRQRALSLVDELSKGSHAGDLGIGRRSPGGGRL